MLLNAEKHRLWVEGNDDKFVISNLLNRRIAPQPFPNSDAKTWIVSTPSKTGGFDDALSAFALASVREPGRPYGEAIATGHFGEKSAEADAFVLWFERLFM